jgi:threonyl-tRNA synthetase
MGDRDESRKQAADASRGSLERSRGRRGEEFFETLVRGSVEELLDAGAHGELDAMRHSSAHVMAEAVLGIFPRRQLGIGPAIDDGFYYDFLLPRPLTPDDLAAIEAGYARFHRRRPPVRPQGSPVREGGPSSRIGQPFKVEILDDLAAKAREPGRRCRPPRHIEHGTFIDLCKGPHVASTGKIGPFKLMTVAGAYWRGSEKRPMLQRIYGTVWPTQEELDAYLNRREEAKRRDHRRLGVQLDLFSFHDVSPGSAFWHPKGQRLWRTLETAIREVQDKRGYQEVSTPMLVHKKLWEQSGHWANYQDNMFVMESEGQTFSLKPMNCPESTFIYKSRLRSYRDLPLRLLRLRPAPSERALRHAVGTDSRSPFCPGRRPHLPAPGSVAGRRSRQCSARCMRSTAGSGLIPSSLSEPGPTRLWVPKSPVGHGRDPDQGRA